MKLTHRLLTAGFLTGFGYAAAEPSSKAADSTPVTATTGENLVVHGQKRFMPAPMPDQHIHDPAETLRDPATGAPMGKFGGAYIDANPVPPINPELQGNQSPINAGIQR